MELHVLVQTNTALIPGHSEVHLVVMSAIIMVVKIDLVVGQYRISHLHHPC